MRRSRLSSKFVGFCLTVLALGACQAVAGIEDRTLDSNFGKPPPSPQCKEYCATVLENCTGEFTVYTTEEFCLGVCALLDPGDDEDVHNNTVACRLFNAKEAKREQDACKAAGPGGNGTCGTDCEAYCQLYPAACPGEYKYGDTENCIKFCETLPQHNSFDVVTDHEGDSVECRLQHVSSASTKPVEHCPHAQIPPSEPWCRNEPLDAPDCDDYCNIELAACEGELKQYESREECMAVCEALDPGTNADQTNNNIGCRRYHSFSASTVPSTHCYHSGPTGDGHCGHDDPEEGTTANCESYCTLFAAACPTEFDAQGDAEDCMTECVGLPEATFDAKYTVSKAEVSTGVSCRVLYAVRAFADDRACASAAGKGQCK